jgi:hypothetical protein
MLVEALRAQPALPFFWSAGNHVRRFAEAQRAPVPAWPAAAPAIVSRLAARTHPGRRSHLPQDMDPRTAGHGRPAPTALVGVVACADATQHTRLCGHAARFVSAAANCSRSVAAWCASRDAA